ncbi:MAG: ATP synthase F1 subunit epsilon [Planctomycetes bacterium]|jgi:F-type H+-transporting ATPase subunit epsilon|nr:ATP synthase F1 subunit epsilon [Planctomycetota bacterium]
MANEKKTIKFEIVTPERLVLREEILQITVPTQEGEITVLPEHIPLVSILKPGVIEVKREGKPNEIMFVSGGFIEVQKDKIVILADSAERGHELDEKQIEEAKAKAEDLKNKSKHLDNVEFTKIASLLERELARSQAFKRWKKISNIN